MKKSFQNLSLFYRKILIPAVLFSLLIMGMMQTFSGRSFGNAFLFIFPVLHYFIYEIRFPNEYGFYANLGFSRFSLWVISVAFSVAVKLICGFL
ncbi:MAG: hypothetical protein QM564_11350 [Bergeyella sp.]